jgi:ADP-heptose:LPS heptosyltransferase
LERRWPLDHFATTIESLTACDHRVVLIGAPNEAPYVRALHDRLSEAARRKTVDCAGKIGLADVFALLHEARCIITNDTGPMHLAIAMKRPTVCLFGPGSPDHYGTLRSNVEILYKPVICSPCIYETDEPPCAGDNTCMQLIRPDEVVDAAMRLIADEPQPSASSRHLLLRDGKVNYTNSHGRALGVVARASLTDNKGG